jgi:hypothetical protein
MRYGDAPSVEMVVPIRSAFTAMKTLAWADRHAPRDLADLAALAELDAFDAEGAALVADMGGWRPIPAIFDHMPHATRSAWVVDLDHQMARPPDPDTCLEQVRSAWAAVTRLA